MVHVRDLRNQIGTTGERPFLFCRVCSGAFSANSGDYFMARPDTILKCCGEPMELVVKQTVYRRA